MSFTPWLIGVSDPTEEKSPGLLPKYQNTARVAKPRVLLRGFSGFLPLKDTALALSACRTRGLEVDDPISFPFPSWKKFRYLFYTICIAIPPGEMGFQDDGSICSLPVMNTSLA